MNPGNWLQILSIIVTLLLFMIPIVYFAGKFVSKLETIITRVGGLENKIQDFQGSCFTKMDANIRMGETDKGQEAQWKAIDKLKKTISRLCFKAGINPDEDVK